MSLKRVGTVFTSHRKNMNSDVRKSSRYIKKYNYLFSYILMSHPESWND